MASKFGMKIVTDRSKQVVDSIAKLTKQRVLVGFPQKTAQRDDTPLTNPQIAYIQNYGAPEANIPAREFMVPGVKDAQPAIVEALEFGAKAALKGDKGGIETGMVHAGTAGRDGIIKKIKAGPFEPLSPRTVAARRRKHPSRLATDPNMTTPLIDTNRLRRAVTYVIEKLA